MHKAHSRKPILRMGWIVALALVVPLAVGVWLDHRSGAAPLFVFAGAVVGILAATVGGVWFAGRQIAALGVPPEASSAPAERPKGDWEDTA